MGPKGGQPIKRSMSVTPGLLGMKSGEGARPKDSYKRMSAFQDYTSKMMSALNNPWKPEVKSLPHLLGRQSHLWCTCQQQGLQ